MGSVRADDCTDSGGHIGVVDQVCDRRCYWAHLRDKYICEDVCEPVMGCIPPRPAPWSEDLLGDVYRKKSADAHRDAVVECLAQGQAFERECTAVGGVFKYSCAPAPTTCKQGISAPYIDQVHCKSKGLATCALP